MKAIKFLKSEKIVTDTKSAISKSLARDLDNSLQNLKTSKKYSLKQIINSFKNRDPVFWP